MITKIFLRLTDYPAFRRIIWKPIYELLAKSFKVKDWSFMNYGYAPLESEAYLNLEPQDEINRYPIQLYPYLATKVNIEGLHILEVGSGRGGGADYISRYLKPKEITGVDIASNAVKLANKHYQNKGIRFTQGSAEQLPFADESFDVVINVESSHAYGSVSRFLSEVKRVLLPEGYLLLADIRTSEALATLQHQINTSGLQVLTEEDISKNVIAGIELEEPIKQKRINENVPRWLQPTFRQFAGVVGSKAHVQLLTKELIYKRFMLKKKFVHK